jgi:hypothetical protein
MGAVPVTRQAIAAAMHAAAKVASKVASKVLFLLSRAFISCFPFWVFFQTTNIFELFTIAAHSCLFFNLLLLFYKAAELLSTNSDPCFTSILNDLAFFRRPS